MLRNQFFIESGDAQLFRSVLNEVLNGFMVDDFNAAIGLERSELERLLKYLSRLPDDSEVELTLVEMRAFHNALRETLDELGIEEFHTRTGFEFEEGERVFKKLDYLLNESK